MAVAVVAALSTAGGGPAVVVADAQGSGRAWYVSPEGLSDQDGSEERPLDLATALSASSPARPGDMIWLRGGVYAGSFTSVLTGTAAAPIVVRQYPGERAVLDGVFGGNTLTIRGAHTWYWGFEVTNSDPRRVFTSPINWDATPPRGAGVNIFGPYIKCINLIVHDTLDGIALWEAALDTEIYGVLTYNNGVVDPLRGHGHGLYIQNRTGTKRIVDVISFGNHATGMKAYGEAGFAQGVHFEGVSSFNNGVLYTSPLAKMENLFVGTITQPADRISLIGNAFYHRSHVLGSNVTLGYVNLDNGSLIATDNFMMGGSVGFAMKHWRQATVRGNSVYAETSNNPNSDQSLVQVKQPVGSIYDWNQNTYVDGTTGRFPFTFNNALNRFGGGNLAYSDWLSATNYDATSSYVAGRPSGPLVILRPNQYEPGRAHLVIYNWNHGTDIPVDLGSAGLLNGDAYEIRDAQNYFGEPVLTGVYAGTPVGVPMYGLNPGAPVGTVLYAPAHTAPEFATFVVIKVTSAPPQTPQTVAAPTTTPLGGTFAGSVSVTLASTTLGANIHYTLDGTAPSGASPVYTGPLSVAATAVVKALGVKAGWYDSSVTSASFIINPVTEVVAAPTMTPLGGTFTGPANVTLTSTTPGATIHYTLNGTTPSGASPVYTGPLSIAATAVVKARGVKAGWYDSLVTSASFIINPISTVIQVAAAPTVNPFGGTFIGFADVTLSTTTPGATIRYSLDGTRPTAASPVYAGPFRITTTAVLQARTVKEGWTDSALMRASFTIRPVVGTPVIAPAGGVFTGSVLITLRSVTVDSYMRYTLDGSVPGPRSPVYFKPFLLTSTATIRVTAFRAGMSPSDVALAAFTVTP